MDHPSFSFRFYHFVRITIIFFGGFCFITSLAESAALVAPISKDHNTRLYSLPVYLKTPLQLTQLHLDLGAAFSWIDCDHNYTSSTYSHAPCGTPLCDAFGRGLACSNCFKPPGPACANDTCGVFPENSVTRKSAISIAIIDSLALPTTDGSVDGPLALLPNYIFSCAPAFLLKGLTQKSVGVAGLGRFNYALPAQLSTGFSLPCYFALCLPSAPSSRGVAFFGSSGPYYFLPGKMDISKSLIYTPLILDPMGSTVITYARYPSDEYYIGLTSFKVNGKTVPINASLLAIDPQFGSGGTKLSTSTRYTILETSIYKAFTAAFLKDAAAMNLTATTPVQPFTVCYQAGSVGRTRVGPAVPNVDLVMQSEDVSWRILGANSMVSVRKGGAEFLCLGFVDGGANPRTTVVIGGHQMEDNLLQFDLENWRLGFSSSLLFRSTTCSNFNFTAQNIHED